MKQAQSALERFQVEVLGGPPSTGPSPRNRQSKAGPTPAALQSQAGQQPQQQQQQPPQPPAQPVRQLKSGDTLELHCAQHLKRVTPQTPAPAVLSHTDVEGRLQALQLAAAQDAAALAALSSSRDTKRAEQGALQARKVSYQLCSWMRGVKLVCRATCCAAVRQWNHTCCWNGCRICFDNLQSTAACARMAKSMHCNLLGLDGPSVHSHAWTSNMSNTLRCRR